MWNIFFTTLGSLVALGLGAAIGAFFERSRARVGYLSKQYLDHVSRLLQLAHAAPSSDHPNEGACATTEFEKIRKEVLDNRASVEADARLFGHKASTKLLCALHSDIEESVTKPLTKDHLSKQVKELAQQLRGPWHRRLTPQNRWFKH
ncbi:hypothetical protein ACFOOM_15605 [Streptomyces echinoruber]|uniref:Uncharacterized protein n=1 Tax=Streptomyces echinoruber TaxID=68898 RepID=A0A918VL72_9ACTN|nr:hypothetical protein [Streptomyces echinoruber]GHA07494.1 hypothetical protein GCM10010389_53450 [Streptomyces echinoruber]